jgi:hypothetical protein
VVVLQNKVFEPWAASFVINITNVLDVGVYPKYKRPNRGVVCYKYNKDFRRRRLFVINITNAEFQQRAHENKESCGTRLL